jgi:hypothetical protein
MKPESADTEEVTGSIPVPGYALGRAQPSRLTELHGCGDRPCHGQPQWFPLVITSQECRFPTRPIPG